MPMQAIHGADIYYEQHGSGEDVVLISGLAVDHRMWDVARLCNRFRVTVFDNRGVGQTGVPDGKYSIDQFAQDTVALCQSLGIERAHFVGHSMGGHIAQHIAAKHGKMVRKLVLACSEHYFSAISSLAIRQQLSLMAYDIPQEVLVRNYLCTLFSFEYLSDPANVECYVQSVLSDPLPVTREGYKRQVEALREHDTRNLLEKITALTCVIGCEQDLLTPLRHSQYLAAHIPNAMLQVIEQSGHVPFIEQPDTFYTLIRDFLLQK